MDFLYNDVQNMLRDSIRKFVEKEIASYTSEWEEKMEFPEDVMKKLGENGFLGIPYPEEYNGQGLGYQEYIIVLEEIARYSASLAIAVAVNGLPQLIIDKFGNEEQKKNYLPKLSSGELTGAFALTEPDYGSDAKSIKTFAERKGDYFVVNGTKRFISQAGVADVYILLSRTKNTGSSHDITAFILTKDMDGVTFGKHEKKMGLNATPTREIYLDDVKIPAENMVGEEGFGFKIAMMALDSGRITIASTAIGIAEAAKNCALEYAVTRKQFGRPIVDFQGVSFPLADMETKINAARLLTQRAAFLRDSGLPYTKEASMAKLFATDVAMEVTTNAVQILGGNGYMRDYPAERYMREAKVMQIVEGTNQIQRLVISRLMIKEVSQQI